MSVAAFGDIEQNVSLKRVEDRITAHFRDSALQFRSPPDRDTADAVDNGVERYERTQRP